MRKPLRRRGSFRTWETFTGPEGPVIEMSGRDASDLAVIHGSHLSNDGACCDYEKNPRRNPRRGRR